jgi:Tripartite tricarboxylate transporter TctB family
MRVAPISAPLGAMLCGGAMTLLALFTLSLPGSFVYPLAYAQVLIALIALLFFASAAISWREAHAVTQIEPGGVSSGGGGVVMTATILLCVLYAASWLVVGYFIATFSYVALQLLLLGERRWWLILALAGGAVLLVYVVFDRLLLLPFPGGLLFDPE